MGNPLYRPVLGADLIARSLSYDLDRPVMIMDGGEEMTAGQLRDRISRYRQVIESLSPRPMRAAVLSKNRVEVPAIMSALTFSQTVATALHPMGSVDDYLYVIDDAEIDLIIYDSDHFEAAAAELREKVPRVKHFVAIGEGGAGESIDEMAAKFPASALVAPEIQNPDSLARIAYSGGTTGKPKGIICTHRGIAMSVEILLSEWEWPDEIRHLICAPLSHAGASVLTPILVRGGSMVVQPGFNPVAFMQAIEKYRITSTLMVPTMVLSLIDHPSFGEFDLSSLEVIFYGASAFPTARLQDAIEKLGPIFFQFYGQAEAPMSVTLMRKAEHLADDPVRLAGCGRPSPQCHVTLLDDDGNEVPDGEPGEICVRGPLLMGGYLNKPEETAQAFEGGWLHTGDVAVRNPEDGFLRIIDRKKDMIISGGFNVYAREVEDVLVTHPGVLRAAVIGVPDPRWGEAVKAVIVADPNVPVDPDDLIALVRNEKGRHQAPKSIDFVDEIPLSAVGKPDKKALRAIYAS